MDKDNPLITWFNHHRRDAQESLKRIAKRPLQIWPTIALFAIALSLPMMLLMATSQLEHVSQSWGAQQQMTLYLNHPPAETMLKELEDNPLLVALEVVSPDMALQDFEKQTGLEKLSGLLSENPLPHQINLTLNPNSAYKDIQEFAKQLEERIEIKEILIDFEWLKKARTFIHIAHLTVIGLGLLFATTVVLVIYNTTRLSIAEDRQTIMVSKLIGATHQFIRRPFLYLGFWQGILGSLCAWILVCGFDKLIYSPMKGLFALSQLTTNVAGLSWLASFELILLGGLLGLAGAWFSVNQYIHRIDIQT